MIILVVSIGVQMRRGSRPGMARAANDERSAVLCGVIVDAEIALHAQRSRHWLWKSVVSRLLDVRPKLIPAAAIMTL